MDLGEPIREVEIVPTELPEPLREREPAKREAAPAPAREPVPA